MRVLHVITRLAGGGAQRNTVMTAALHREAGIDAEILAGDSPPGRDQDFAPLARRHGVPIHLLPGLARDPAFGPDLAAVARLSRHLHERPCDLLHTHTSKAGFLGRLAARLSGLRAVVHTPHGHVFHSYYGPLTTRAYVLLERCAADWAARLVALTRRERDEHLALGIGREEQFSIVPSGIDLDRFRQGIAGRSEARRRLGVAADAFVIGVVGRLAPVKGQSTLVDALPRLCARVSTARVVLVGDGSQREPLAARARELGVADRLRFHGHEADPAALYPGFDVLAVPSLNEGMGRVVLEAMAASVPVVASRVGGLIDLIDDRETGLLVPPADPAALADALARLCAEPALGRSLAATAARRLAPEHSEPAMARRLLEIYREVLDQPRV